MKTPVKITPWVEAISIILLIATFVLAFYFYAHFPDRVVTHWGFNGQPNGWMGKFGGAFFIPIMLVGMYFLLLFVPALDPKKERYADFAKPYNIFRAAILFTLFVVYLAAGLYNLGYPVKINMVVPLVIGLLMIVLGNFMGKIKNNWFVGIRTPWTLSSENVWNKTHRFGGYAFVIFGILIIISPFATPAAGLALFIAGIVIVTLGTFVYSYLAYRAEKKQSGEKTAL